MGIELDAIHARLCLPALNCSVCFAWQPAQVSGVGIFASFASSIFLCSDPWQDEQSTAFLDIFPSRYCLTTPGVTFLWQSMQALLAAAKAVLAVKSTSTKNNNPLRYFIRSPPGLC